MGPFLQAAPQDGLKACGCRCVNTCAQENAALYGAGAYGVPVNVSSFLEMEELDLELSQARRSSYISLQAQGWIL
jgi:hypothetical protein